LTQQQLAERAGVGLSTLRAFEAGTRVPIRANMDALRRSLEAAGVRLVWVGETPAGIVTDAARGTQL
jgi:transcriptional regulator with XRE-family HTH domain